MAKLAKIALPEDLSKPFAIPADWTPAMIDEAIVQVRESALALLDPDKGTADAEQRTAGSMWLLDTIDGLKARQGEIVATEQAAADALEAARARANANDAAAEDESEAPTDSTDDDEGDDDKGEPGGPPAPTTQDAPPAEAVLVASARWQQDRAALTAAARAARGQHATATAPALIKSREAYMTAAAEVPGFRAGEHVGWDGLGQSAHSRFKALPQPGHGGGGRVVLGIGSIHTPADDRLVASGRGTDEFADIDEALAWAVSGERLKEATGYDDLVAAGGWCAPSETLYDLLDLTTADGLLDIPGINVSRGGVRYSLGPDFSAVFNAGANFTKTEAQAIAGSTKPVVNIPCPAFNEYRMLVDGMYFTGDILSAKGYPEAYADFLAKAGKAFEHYENMKTIADMVTASTAVDLRQPASTPAYFDTLSASTELLGAVELQIVDARYRNRLSLTAPVEVVLPLFARGIIRSDLSKRTAVANPADITDAQIDAFFAERGANVQYVYDWQDAFSGVSAGFGAATAIKAWPGELTFLVYPAGTFVRALNDVIELNAVYDSVLLQTNQYVALFMERGRLVLKRGWDARSVTVRVPTTGATGATVDYTASTRQPTV